MSGFDFLKREKLWLGGVACLGVGAMILFDRTRSSAPPPIVWEEKPLYTQEKPSPDKPAAETSVTVDVDGAVKTPGVYTLPAGSRLKDALTAAGGAWSNADFSGYNRAALLRDGTKITIPKRFTGPAEREPSGSRGRMAFSRPPGLRGRLPSVPPLAVEVPAEYRGDDSTYRAEPLPEAVPSPSPSGERPKGKHSSGKKEVHEVNVNSAGADELCALPGVGPSTAAAIVAYRTEHGPFASVEALDGVKGIGPKKLEAMRPYVRL
ncbi:helix-hairpin-helix domain-containing protein [soil metagenome]